MKPSGGYILGVDGGNSKTHVAVADSSGRLLSFVEGPTTSHEALGLSKARRVMADLAGRALSKARVSRRDIRGSCFGLAGTDIPLDFVNVMRHVIKPLGLAGKVKLHNDAFLAIFNDKYRDRGIGVTAGAGNKWVGVNGEKEWMIEGFEQRSLRGMIIRDLIRTAEAFLEPTPFMDRVLKHLGYGRYQDVIERRFFGGARPFVKPLTRAQRVKEFRLPEWFGRELGRGSRGALEMARRYGVHVAGGVVALIRKLKLSRLDFDVVLSGSVLANLKPVRKAAAATIRKAAPRARVVGAKFRPVRGALLYAAHLAWGSSDGRGLADRRLSYG